MTAQQREASLAAFFKLFLLSYIQGTRNEEPMMKYKSDISALRVLVREVSG